MNYPLISEYVEAKEKILCFYENINFYPSKIVYLLPDLFDKVIRELWLPHNLWENFSVNLVCWDKNRWTTGYDSILNSVVGEFSKKSRPNALKMLENYATDHKYDYIVDYIYNIFTEMGVVNYFVENVDILVRLIKENHNYKFK